jgi:uncharacterized membrane protein
MTSDEVHFEEAKPGRPRVDVTMNYCDPSAGEAVANIHSNPERKFKEDLENFASIVELGGPGMQTSSR